MGDFAGKAVLVFADYRPLLKRDPALVVADRCLNRSGMLRISGCRTGMTAMDVAQVALVDRRGPATMRTTRYKTVLVCRAGDGSAMELISQEMVGAGGKVVALGGPAQPQAGGIWSRARSFG